MSKHAMPEMLPSRETADHQRLVVEPGPWTEDTWAVVQGVSDVRRTGSLCSVPACDRNGYVSPHDISLCQPHWHQWRRAGEPEDVAEWLPTAKKPQTRRRPNAISLKSIDFLTMPPLVANEIRFVVGRKVTAGDWTPNKSLLEYLDALAGAVRQTRVRSLLDRRPEDWLLLVQQRCTPSAATMAQSYSKTFFAVLHRALTVDPWAEDRWLYKDNMDGLIHRGSQSNNGNNVNWASIRQDWLREPLKAHARPCLITGRKSWGTVITWSQAATALSKFLTEEGIEDPLDLDRSVFLDYLSSLHEQGASKSALSKVNVIASLLAVLHDEATRAAKRGATAGQLFGSEVFLFYGENAVEKTREPKPYPDDVVTRVDQLVLSDPDLHQSAREMLQLTRWGGLRISELITLPLDCLVENGKGGYWVRYWMTKTKNWRRFPIPDDLAQSLLRQQALVRDTYGTKATYMFPSPSRSNPQTQRDLPWSPNGFRRTVAASFERNGITQSTITGELISGGAIHRYRHTIGTTLLNNGWSQREVQEFLGHDSPTMTSAYAAITDETLTRKVREFQAQQEEARVTAGEAVHHPGVEALRHKFVYELAGGGCTLPANQSCDVRDNPCEGCVFFAKGGADEQSVQEGRRKRLKLHIEQATDPAEVALNQRTLDAIETTLETSPEEPVR